MALFYIPDLILKSVSLGTVKFVHKYDSGDPHGSLNCRVDVTVLRDSEDSTTASQAQMFYHFLCPVRYSKRFDVRYMSSF